MIRKLKRQWSAPAISYGNSVAIEKSDDESELGQLDYNEETYYGWLDFKGASVYNLDLICAGECFFGERLTFCEKLSSRFVFGSLVFNLLIFIFDRDQCCGLWSTIPHES